MKLLTYILIEDDPVFINSFRLMAGAITGFKYTEHFGCIESWMDEGCPIADIFILDIGLPGISGIEGIEKILERNSQSKVVMATIFDDEERLFKALKNGACGYVIKNEAEFRLEQILTEVSTGGMAFSATISDMVLKYFRKNKRKAKCLLSIREHEILILFKEGLTKKQIAIELTISYTTVESHIKNIYRKLHVKNGVQAIVKAMEQEII